MLINNDTKSCHVARKLPNEWPFGSMLGALVQSGELHAHCFAVKEQETLVR